MSAEAYKAFVENQNAIYDRSFRAGHANFGVTEGTSPDPGANPQGAFLLAWRMPGDVGRHVGEFSQELSDTSGGSIVYGEQNAHTTLSDHGLHPELIVNADDPEHAELFNIFGNAVRYAIDELKTRGRSDLRLQYEGMHTNGKTVVALGSPSRGVFDVNEAVRAMTARHGVDLKGAWGAHMTTGRFISERAPDEVADIKRVIEAGPVLGEVHPAALEVGSFRVDPTHGFQYTTHERFELGEKS